MAKQLVIYITPRENNFTTPSEKGQYNPGGKLIRRRSPGPLTPRIKEKGARRVINLPHYDPSMNYRKLAEDLCNDSGDKYHGHAIN